MIRSYPEAVFKRKMQPERADFLSTGQCLEVCEAVCEYRPRRPEESVLYGAVAGHLETFLARQRARGRLVPGFVERELRSFLDCGILARGFLRVHCDACRLDRVVPYSCKCRGFCPSCSGRRMADTAAHLVDRVFPEVPVRQWVLSVPFALRYRLAYDSTLVREVLRIFVRAVFASIRRRVGIPASNRQARSGARMRMLSAIDSPDANRKILGCLGLPTRAPPIAPALTDRDEAALWCAERLICSAIR